MFEYQEAKHGAMNVTNNGNESHTDTDLVQPAKNDQSSLPQPTAYPAKYHPGFPTTGLFRIVRHANFAAEQLFWVVQALFVVAAGESSGVTKNGWVMGSVFGPCFVVSCS